MKEKILKLAEQAGGFPLYPDHPEGDVTMAFRERALERLVDMIVRECANLARHDAVRKMSGDDIAGMIEMHFGVEK